MLKAKSFEELDRQSTKQLAVDWVEFDETVTLFESGNIPDYLWNYYQELFGERSSRQNILRERYKAVNAIEFEEDSDDEMSLDVSSGFHNWIRRHAGVATQ